MLRCSLSSDVLRGCHDISIECEREKDDRWLAEVPQLAGVIVYGSTADEAMDKAEALALRVLAERIELGLRPMIYD